MVTYHDAEWGVPVYDDHVLFEFLTLEAAQAGLSWSTVLRKRGGYSRAFAKFDFNKVARFRADKVEKLMLDPSIIRNRAKISAAINNAQRFLEVRSEFESFANYLWRFVDGAPRVNRWRAMGEVPATTSISDAVAKDLKKRGFKFLGSTVMYAHMQATGMVNDHLVTCFRHQEVGRSLG
jgi:DNA-3-methyladenine glycosylase I